MSDEKLELDQWVVDKITIEPAFNGIKIYEECHQGSTNNRYEYGWGSHTVRTFDELVERLRKVIKLK